MAGGIQPPADFTLSSPRFTCTPYLPYVTLALQPVFDAAMLGVAVLAIVSIAFGTASRIVHTAASYVFFYGMVAVSGLWIYFQANISARFPIEKCAAELGIVPGSLRYRLHVHLFWAKVTVLLVLNWILIGIGLVLGWGFDNWGVYNATSVFFFSSLFFSWERTSSN